MAAPTGGRFRQLIRKYGKVALGVHFSVSAVSITGLYIAIKNNVDVESVLEKFHMGTASDKDDTQEKPQNQSRNRTAELAASTGGTIALALLFNKALFPVRVPITIALTPPIARFLARRNIIKTGV